MDRTKLRLSKEDHLRLLRMLDSDLVAAILPEDQHRHLSDRLRASQIVDLDEVEPLVSMNDIVQLLDVDTGVRETFQLVFPEEADILVGRLSVLAPVGTSLLGSGLGDAIIWITTHRVRRLCVETICRPEDESVSSVGLSNDKCRPLSKRTILLGNSKLRLSD